MITISDQGTKIKEGHITKVEGAIDGVLPPTYKNFLLATNGGIPTPDTVDIHGAPGSPTDIQVFFGIGREVQSSDLIWNIKLISNRFPGMRLLPIACDSGGNVFCLDIFKEFSGGVVYFDLSASNPSPYEVAPSFEVFLEKIRVWS